MKGEVIGILISTLDQGTASFVLPIEAAEKAHKDYVRFGDVRPGWIGVTVVTAEQPRHGSTAIIESLFANGPADKAGLKPADMLLAVGDRKITSPEDMMDACFFLSAEDQVPVKVDRDGQELTIPVETADFPGRRISPRALTLTGEPPDEPVKIGE
jgi:S1-C subfamily serine protease